MKDWQKRVISGTDFPLGLKSEPPFPPPIGRVVRLFLKTCSKPRNLMILKLTVLLSLRPPCIDRTIVISSCKPKELGELGLIIGISASITSSCCDGQACIRVLGLLLLLRCYLFERCCVLGVISKLRSMHSEGHGGTGSWELFSVDDCAQRCCRWLLCDEMQVDMVTLYGPRAELVCTLYPLLTCSLPLSSNQGTLNRI